MPMRLPKSIATRVHAVAEAASVKDDSFAARLHDLMHECCALQSERDYGPEVTKPNRRALIIPEIPNYKDNEKQASLIK